MPIPNPVRVSAAPRSAPQELDATVSESHQGSRFVYASLPPLAPLVGLTRRAHQFDFMILVSTYHTRVHRSRRIYMRLPRCAECPYAPQTVGTSRFRWQSRPGKSHDSDMSWSDAMSAAEMKNGQDRNGVDGWSR